MSAPPVTSYTIELIDTEAAVVIVELLLLLCVEDVTRVLVLLLTVRDAEDGMFVEARAGDVGDEDVDASDVVLVDEDDEDGVDDGEEASEACADVVEAEDPRLDDVGIALGVSVTVLTDTVVAVADDSVTVLYTI